MPNPPEQVFGPLREKAARAAMYELYQALQAYAEAGGGWAPQRYLDRVNATREVRDMYAEYMDTSLGV